MKDFAIKGDWEFLNTIKLIAETYGWKYCHEFNEFTEERLKTHNCLFFTTGSFMNSKGTYKDKLFSLSYVSEFEKEAVVLDTEDFNKCEEYISGNIKDELEMFVDWLHENKKEHFDNIEWFYSLIKEFRER